MKEAAIVSEAKNYLLSFDKVAEETLRLQLNEWKEKKPDSLSRLFRVFLVHAQNRQGMPNSIGDIDNLATVLFEFDPVKVAQNYKSWDSLFDSIDTSTYTPPGRMERNNSKNYWVIYCKSMVSISTFLASFRDIEEFDSFVEMFYTNKYSRLALPLLLESELYGIGFALACDFLKDSGYPEFIKPDTHISDIARGIGITNESTLYRVFKDMITFCQRAGVLPFEVDKIFWLIGSGRFYLSDLKVPTSKWEFIDLINEKGLRLQS